MDGAVAQLGERRVRNAKVAGSIPAGSTKYNRRQPRTYRPRFVNCARRGASGALLPGIRYTGVEFPPEGLFAPVRDEISGVEGWVLHNNSLLNPVRTGR